MEASAYLNETTIQSYKTIYSSVTRVEDDKEIAKDVIGGLKAFIYTNINDNSLQRQINYAASYPIAADKCNIAIQIIDSNSPVILVVEDSANYHEKSKLYKFYWEREHVIKNQNLLANWNERQIKMIGTSAGITIAQITITETAMQSLKNCAQLLTAEKRKQEIVARQNESEIDRLTRWHKDASKYSSRIDGKPHFDQDGYEAQIRNEKIVTGEYQIEQWQIKLLKKLIANDTIMDNEKEEYIDWYRHRPYGESKWIKREGAATVLFILLVHVNNLTDEEYQTHWRTRGGALHSCSLFNRYFGDIHSMFRKMEEEDVRKPYCDCCTLF